MIVSRCCTGQKSIYLMGLGRVSSNSQWQLMLHTSSACPLKENQGSSSLSPNRLSHKKLRIEVIKIFEKLLTFTYILVAFSTCCTFGNLVWISESPCKYNVIKYDMIWYEMKQYTLIVPLGKSLLDSSVDHFAYTVKKKNSSNLQI